MFESKLQQPSESQYTITIPIGMVKMKGWKKGDKLLLRNKPNGFVVEKGE